MELNSEEILRTVFEELKLKEGDFDYFTLLRCKRALDDRLGNYEDEVADKANKAAEDLYTEEDLESELEDAREEEHSDVREAAKDAAQDAICEYFEDCGDEIIEFAKENDLVPSLIRYVTDAIDLI